MTSSPEPMTPPIPEGAEGAEGTIAMARPKHKGRLRLLHSLQRMSSSPSLAKLGRGSSSYTGGGRASMSCVSLTSSTRSGHSYGASYSTTHSAGSYSTAPTSITSSPDEQESSDKIKKLDVDSVSNPLFPRTVSIPPEVRPSSKDTSTLITSSALSLVEEPLSVAGTLQEQTQKTFRFWDGMPYELALHILAFLKPRELVRCSLVSRYWHDLCLDGQLWSHLDTEEYYRDIPAAALTRLMTRAGSFVRTLNLRGCVQLPEHWGSDGYDVSDVCRNLESFSLEGCRIDRSSVHHFLIRNPRLVHINFSGLKDVSNSAMRIIAQGCPQLEYLNVSWCKNVDTRGLHRIIQGCNLLKDLRAGEIRGFTDKAFMLEMFAKNTLERLTLSHCDLDDESLQYLIQGEDPPVDPLTNVALVPPRRLRYLNISRCKALTTTGLRSLTAHIPDLHVLNLSSCGTGITDSALTSLFPTTPLLIHLDLEELDELTNATLHALAKSPCAAGLCHLNISYCEQLGDPGMLAVLKACSSIRSLVLDNTRVSDLSLLEAATHVRQRSTTYPSIPPSALNTAYLPPSASNTAPCVAPAASQPASPSGACVPALHMVVYDCSNITWTGIRSILAHNTQVTSGGGPAGPQGSSLTPTNTNAQSIQNTSTHPLSRVITLKCFYGYQPTVSEHTKRILRGDPASIASAARLERKWAEYMLSMEEAGVAGAGGRRRRRRWREAAAGLWGEDDGDGEGNRGEEGVGNGVQGGIQGRRRARSGGCAVM